MADTPEADRSSEQIRHDALRQELEAARRRRDGYQALLKDLPEIFEGRFRERLRPLQQRNEELLLEGVALRERIRRALPQERAAAAADAPIAAPRPGESGEAGGLQPPTARPPADGMAEGADAASSKTWAAMSGSSSAARTDGSGVSAAAPLTPGWDSRIRLPGEVSVPAAAGPRSSPVGPRADGRERKPLPLWSLTPREMVRALGPRLHGSERSMLLAAAAALGVALALPHLIARQRPQAAPAVSTTQTSPRPPQAPPMNTATAVATISSSEPNWLEVESVGGDSLHYGLMQGELSVPLGQGVRLRSGRPELLRIRIRIPGLPERVLGPVDSFDWQTIMMPVPRR